MNETVLYSVRQIVDRLELFADKLDDQIGMLESMSDRQDYLQSLATLKSLLKEFDE